MDACENAPPVNIFNKPNYPSADRACNAASCAGSTPGITTNVPAL